ncbi:hypothetical protein ABPG72_001355 [Tetrahymena utriculariae]
MSYFNQKPTSFLNSNSSDLRRDIAMNEIFDLKGKQNHQSSLFGINLSQFTGSTAERSFLNLNVRDSLTAENIKFQTQPQNNSMFNGNIAGHNTYSQTPHLAFKSNDNSRQASSRENQADYFSNTLSNKRNNFKSVDGLYENQYQQIGVYSHDNSSKAAENQFSSQQGTKNYYKFSNLVGNTSYQKPQYENYSLMIENTDDSFIFSKDKMKKNSRSSSILGENLFSTQNQQYDLNSSYVQPNSVQNTVRNSLLTLNSNSNQSFNQGFKYRTQYQNSSESKKKNELESNSKDGGYKVGQDFAKKLRLQKCESTCDFQVSQFQQPQTKSPLTNNAKNQNLQQQNQNRSKIASSADQNQVNQKLHQQNNSKAQTEESTIYIPTQETKSSCSTHNFDSNESAEKNQLQQDDQQTKMNQNTQFSKQWEELNSFKKNTAQEEQKSKELTEKLIQGNSTSKIDFKSIKLSRTPLQTIDIKQQLANIDQKAKLEAYGESMQPPDLTKVEQFVPQLLQKNSTIQSVKTPSKQDDEQQQSSQEAKNLENQIAQNTNAKDETIKQNEDNKNDNKKKQSTRVNNQKINIQSSEQKKADQPINNEKSLVEEKPSQKNQSKNQKNEETVKKSSKTLDQNQKFEENKSKKQNRNEIKIQDQVQAIPAKKQSEDYERKENQEIKEEQSVEKSKNNIIIEKKESSPEEKNQQNDKNQKQNVQIKNQQNQQQITQKTQNQDKIEQKPKPEPENPINQQQQLNLNNNQMKQQSIESTSAQNSSRSQVDIQGIVQNIRSIKQDLKQKRNNRNIQEENISKSSAKVLQTDPKSTPFFQITTQQLQYFSQISQKENNSHIESLKNEIFSDFGKKGKEVEQQESLIDCQQELIQQENQILIDSNLNSQKNKNKFQMDVIEEEIRTKNTSQEQINTRSSFMSFVQDQNAQQLEEENQIEVSFNGINNDIEYISNQNIDDDNQQISSALNDNHDIAVEVEYSDADQLDKYNEFLQQELSLDLIMKYQTLLNEASRASVKNLPLKYTKEMVNLAYCILQTVRNCSQIPKDSDEDQEEQF